MKKKLILAFILSFCFTSLFLVPWMAPRSYAAARTPERPQSGGPCYTIENTGISYDATAYTTLWGSNGFGDPQPMGFFSLAGSDAPAIGASACLGSGLTGLMVGKKGADWYNVLVTVNGVTTQVTPPAFEVFPYANVDRTQIQMHLQASQQYTLQVQSCRWVARVIPSCGSWSPTLQFVTAANSYCQNGYVWREAAPFDRVCVTPDQRSLIASDNSQATSRVDPTSTSYPQACASSLVSSYVWREAFGGDYVCVSVVESHIVASDNGQALARILAF